MKVSDITLALVGRTRRLLNCGFALIELSVLIAFVGTLATRLLPAPAKANDRDRQIQCLNNQKSMGLILTV